MSIVTCCCRRGTTHSAILALGRRDAVLLVYSGRVRIRDFMIDLRAHRMLWVSSAFQAYMLILVLDAVLSPDGVGAVVLGGRVREIAQPPRAQLSS